MSLQPRLSATNVVRREGRQGLLKSTRRSELLVSSSIFPLDWFWTRALNCSSILEVKLVVALTMLKPLAPLSQFGGIDCIGSRSNNCDTRRIENYYSLGTVPGGSLGAAGLLVDPLLSCVASCEAHHHLVVYPATVELIGQCLRLGTDGENFMLIYDYTYACPADIYLMMWSWIQLGFLHHRSVVFHHDAFAWLCFWHWVDLCRTSVRLRLKWCILATGRAQALASNSSVMPSINLNNLLLLYLHKPFNTSNSIW